MDYDKFTSYKMISGLFIDFPYKIKNSINMNFII